MDIKPSTSSSSYSANYNHKYYSAEIETLTRDHLSMQVDVVGWNHKHNLLAVGGYKINPKDTTLRTGILYLIMFNSSLPSGSAIIQEENLPGILDLKWEPSEYGYVVLATSNSIVIYGVIKHGNGMPRLQRNYTCFLEVKTSLMAAYIEWITPTELIYCDTCGTVTLLGLVEQGTDSEDDDEDEENDPLCLSPRRIKKEPGAEDEDDDPLLHLTEIDRVNLHDSIIWVVHYNLPRKVIFTGADDGTFIAFHRTNFHKRNFWFIKRFPVGITSITTKDDIVAVGSYDDILRIFSFKTTSDADKRLGLIQHTEINLGGAPWRTVWLPNLYEEEMKAAGKVEYKIAVAAARNGIHMLTLKRKPVWAWSRHVSCLDYQGTLAYGIDVKTNPAEKTYTVATCYYDNSALHIWKTNAY